MSCIMYHISFLGFIFEFLCEVLSDCFGPFLTICDHAGSYDDMADHARSNYFFYFPTIHHQRRFYLMTFLHWLESPYITTPLPVFFSFFWEKGERARCQILVVSVVTSVGKYK